MPIQFTRKGRYEVWRDGQKISEHNQEREATEQIINHSSVYGDGDYEIKGYLVVARVVGSVNPQTGDTTPPTTPGSVSASATSATTGTVTWTASTDASGVAGYQIFLDGAPLNPTTTNLSYSLTGLSPSTQYAVTVVAFDAAGNNSVAGGPALFTTDANSAPVWSLGNQAYETGASVSISLDTVCTDADGDAITYSLVSGSLPSGLALSGARNETLSGTVDTVETAVFTLGASDGIASIQNVALTFTITAPDTVAPAAPTGLSVASTTSSSINLDWADNAESDLAFYDVYRSTVGASGPWGKRNGSPLTSSTYQDSGLNELTQYWYYVTATDNSDNESSASSVVNSTTTAAPSAPYDLYVSDNKSRGAIPFAVNWPSEPDTSANGTVVVTNQAELDAANALNGVRISIQAGTYTTPFVGGQDQWFDLQPGAILNGDLFLGSYFGEGTDARIKITGGTINGQFFITGITDFLLDGVTVVASNFEVPNPRQAVRVAIVNSDIRSDNYAFGSFNYGGYTYSDFIIAGNYLQSGTAGSSVPVRIQGANRVIIVDNHMHETGNGYAFRIHDYADNVWIRNNMISTTGGTNGQIVYSPNHTTDDGIRTLGSVWSYDNVHYVLNGGTGLQLFDYPRFDQAVIVGHRAYSTSYGSPTSFNPFSGYTTGPGWSQSDNVADAYTSTPSWPGAGVPVT